MEGVPKVKILPGCEQLASLCRMGDVDLLRAHLEEAKDADLSAPLDSDGNTGLHMAAFFGHVRMTQELIERSAQVDAREKRMRTPLHIACKEGYAEVCLELLVKKADANAADRCGETSVHKASIPRSMHALKVVCEQGGADLSASDSLGMTPLLHAAKDANVEFIAYLLAQDPGLASARNQARWTALHLAANGQDVKSNSLSPPRYYNSVRALVEARAAVDEVDEDNRTPLHRAAAIGNCASAGLLIDAGADVEAADACRWRPIHHACLSSHEKMVMLLLERKAAVEAKNLGCVTPLALATAENMPGMAELLVKHRADPNLRGPGFESPMAIARKDKGKYEDILSVFISYTT
jgi:ankyrin repeat protein